MTTQLNSPSEATQKFAGKWLLPIVFLALAAMPGSTNDDVIFKDGFENHAPEIISVPPTVALIDALYSYEVIATDSDGDLLHYGLVIAPENMSIGELSGEISWTPHQLGVFAVEVLVSDGNRGTALQQWEIEAQTVLDSDHDGLSDDEELDIGTDPHDPDTDNDGLKDGEEVNQYGTDPLDADMDDDGLNDGDEIKVHFTQPGIPDTDDDTYRDGEEIDYGTDPLDGMDFPVNEPPADPADVAPELDPTVATTVFGSSEFLYRGLNRVQAGVANGIIEPVRAAVIRGKVMSRDGTALSGVLITVLHHPEFGETISRADGAFDLVVNGGGYLTVNYASDGYLPAQRQVDVPWQDWITAPSVVLIAADPSVTAVDLTQPGIQVAQGSVVTDDRGTRQNTLLFPEEVEAELVFPDGSTTALTSLTLNITEYSVGPDGELAMPAQMPPGIGYTYCVEIAAQEAPIAGANEVRFSSPVPNYVENYLGFPAGVEVPAYYYDDALGVWVPAPPGRVVDFLGTIAGLADLDTDGDGAADDGATLAELGITDAERAQLAGLYSPGTSLWRVQLEHLSTVDYNMPYDYPESYYPGTLTVESESQLGVGCKDTEASTISCQNQTLGETMPIVGTRIALHYESSRVPGRIASRHLRIPIPGFTECSETLLEVQFAGKLISETFPCSAEDSVYEFIWDGTDIYGREVTGEAPVAVQIARTYPAERCARKWNSAIEQWETVCRSLPGTYDALWSGTWRHVLSNPDARRQGFGGWTVNTHHRYEPLGRLLSRGDGSRRSAGAIGQIISKIVQRVAWWYGLDVGPDGTVYLADYGRSEVITVRADPSSFPIVIAGNKHGYNGDGIPASTAWLSSPRDVAVAPDGSVYIADTGNRRVRRIDPDGIIWTVAGNGTDGEPCNGCLATDTPLNQITKIDLGPDGSLYMLRDGAEEEGDHVLKLDTAGIVSEVYAPDPVVHGGRSFGVILNDIAVGPDSALYVTEYYCGQRHGCTSERNHTVVKVLPTGDWTVIAGTGTNGFSGDGGPALDAQLNRPEWLALGPDQSVYVVDWADGSRRIRKITPDGMIRTIAGCGNIEDSCILTEDYGLLAGMTFLWPYAIAHGPDGLYISNEYTDLVRIEPPLPGLNEGELMLPDESGDKVFFFDVNGRHLRTANTLTGSVITKFSYGETGLLTRITDGDGNVTTFERDGSGNPTAIVGPFGQRTELTLDTNGYLARISNPAGEAWQFGYTNGGLLSSTTNPNGYASTYVYDSVGRIVQNRDAIGGEQSLVRTTMDNGYQVSRTTPMGRTTTYGVENLATGDRQLTNVFPDGTSASVLLGTDGSQTLSLPDGSIEVAQSGPDPRFGMQSPYIENRSVTLPGGLEVLAVEEQSAVVADGPLSVANLTTSYTFAGASTEDTYTASTRTLASTSPEGRTTAITVDDQARPLQLNIPGLYPMDIAYDAAGRVESISTGVDPELRSTTFTFAADGFPDSATDPLGLTVYIERDAAGRMIRSTLPDETHVDFEYDAAGNLLSLTPPGRSAHSFAYDAGGYLTTITPPAVAGTGPTSFNHNTDGAYTSIAMPGDETISFAYDSAGRPASLTLSASGAPVASYVAAWNASGLVASIAGPGSQNLNFTYDGPLMTEVQWSGSVAGTVTRTFDDALRISSEQINAADAITWSYDDDDLVINAGELAISRDADNGLPVSTSLGLVSDTWDYDGFGYVTHYRAHSDGTTLYEVDFERDELGNVTRKVETVGSETHTFDYTYDLRGQLTQVKLDDVVIEAYTYDDNGNRLSATVEGETLTATYDSQDRLMTYGTASFDYKPSGMLMHRTDSGNTTDYAYDPLGNLLGVTLPSGTTITYLLDGADRRVSRQINGTPAERFLYAGQRPVAQLDAAGDVVSRLVYAGGYLPVYLVRGGVVYRILADQSSNVRLVVNTVTGDIAQRMEYDAFGHVIFDSNPGFQPFGFAGGLYDPDTGLVQFGARDYDPTIGRWTAKDPIGFAGLDTNLYRYVYNNPVNLIDPSGLNAVIDIIYGVAASAYDTMVDPTGALARTINNGLFDIYGYVTGVDVSPYHQESSFVSGLQSTVPGVDPFVDTSSPEFTTARACGDLASALIGGGVKAAGLLRSARAARAAKGLRAANAAAAGNYAKSLDEVGAANRALGRGTKNIHVRSSGVAKPPDTTVRHSAVGSGQSSSLNTKFGDSGG